MRRTDLYRRVWETPVSNIAREVGLSDTRVAAICRRHRIPLPPRGHWSKAAAGRSVPPPPLPNADEDFEIQLGRARPGPQPANRWVVPGVLERADDEAASLPEPAPAAKANTAAPLDQLATPLVLAQALAVQFHRDRAMHDLLEALSIKALMLPPKGSTQVLEWVNSVRAQLDSDDVVSRLVDRLTADAAGGRDVRG